MRVVARITAVIFLLISAIFILGGGFFAFSGIGAGGRAAAGMAIGDPWVMLRWGKFFLGGTMAVQGLFLGAIGEGLWLLADIAGQRGGR